jgi:hypothetical protein
MSGIPTNIITVQFPDDGGGDPAGNGGFDMQPMLDALRGIQINVGSINANVKAILEVLRRMSSMRPSGGGGTRGDGGEAGGRGSATSNRRASSRARFAADILEYRKAIRSGRPLSEVMRASHADLLEEYRSNREGLSAGRLRAATRLRGVEVFAEGFEARASQKAANESLRAQMKDAREAAKRERERLRVEAAAHRASVRAGRSRMSNSMAQRLSELRKKAGMPGATTASIGLSPEEQAVLAGEASPSGLPGTRSYFRGVEGIARGLQTPPPLPAAPVSRWTSMAGGVMRLVTSVGRVLAVAGMITALVAKIWGIMKFMSSSAQAQRQGFAKVDPVFAAMEAQYRISSLMSDIAVARDPAVRQSMQNFTNAQMARSQGQVPLRRAWARISSYGGAQYEGMMSALEMTVGGLLGGDMRIWSLGMMSQFGYLAQLAIPGLGIGVNQYVQSYVQSQLTAGVKNANQLFMGDIASMTAGRFSESQAYMGKNASARNWWTARP